MVMSIGRKNLWVAVGFSYGITRNANKLASELLMTRWSEKLMGWCRNYLWIRVSPLPLSYNPLSLVVPLTVLYKTSPPYRGNCCFQATVYYFLEHLSENLMTMRRDYLWGHFGFSYENIGIAYDLAGKPYEYVGFT